MTEESTAKKAPGPYVFSALVGELLFVLLPLLVLGLVFAYKSKGAVALFSSAEWAFASALLFGQCIVKFVSGVAEARVGIPERVGLVVACLIVFGLVPSMVVLALILVSERPDTWLVLAQIALFVVAAGAFLFFAGSAQTVAVEERHRALVKPKKE